MLRLVALVTGLALVGGAAAYGLLQAQAAPPARVASAGPGPLLGLATLARTLTHHAGAAPTAPPGTPGTLAAAQSWVWSMSGGPGSGGADSAPLPNPPALPGAPPPSLTAAPPAAPPAAPVVRVHAGLPGGDGGGGPSGVTVHRGLP